jgi:hypothetical protein
VPGLFIRYDTSDNGSRLVPDGLPAGTVWWLSPDLRLCRGGTATDTAVVGLDHRIRVLVRNNQATALTNARVEIFPCRFGPVPVPVPSFPAGAFDRRACRVLPDPTLWDTTTCGDIGNATTNPCTVPAASGGQPGAAWFETNWTPQQSDIDWLTGATGNTQAHLCLLANCFADAPDDGQALSRNAAGGILDHDVVHNPHHAQHNITVAQSSLGKFKFKIWAANAADLDGTFVLQARVAPTRRIPLPRGDIFERLTTRLGGGRNLEAGGPAARRLDGLLRRLPVGPVVRDVRLDVEGLRGNDLRVPIEAGEIKPVDLDLQVDRPGWSRVDVVQRDDNGVTVGGARVLLLGLPRHVTDELGEFSVFR